MLVMDAGANLLARWLELTEKPEFTRSLELTRWVELKRFLELTGSRS